MAFIKCKECEKEVSSKAKTCPHCGAGLRQPPRTLAYRDMAALLALALIAFGVVKYNEKVVGDTASDFVLEQLGKKNIRDYEVARIYVPYTSTVSTRHQVDVYLRRIGDDELRTVPVAITGTCLFGGCGLAVKAIDLLRLSTAARVRGEYGLNASVQDHPDKLDAAEAGVRSLKGALDSMRMDISRYPTEKEGLDILFVQPSDPVAARRWRGPYLQGAVPVDPWGSPYVYMPQTGNRIALYSNGHPVDSGGVRVGLLPSREAMVEASPGLP